MIDVLVVGGGPIGLAAAIEARMAGMSVVVVEPREGPIDKACGEGLMPGAVAALVRLGVRPAGRPFAGIGYRRVGGAGSAGARRAGPISRVGIAGRGLPQRDSGVDRGVSGAGGRAADGFGDSDFSVEDDGGGGVVYGVDYRFRSGTGLGVRRTTLHAALAARAAELGVDRVVGRVGPLEQDAGSVTAGGIRAAWLLGCDGLHSTVSALVGLDTASHGPRRFGLRRHFAVAPWSDLVEVRWLPDAEIYITPIADDLVGVAVLGPAHADYAGVVATVPELANAAAVTPLRGAGPLRRRTARRTAGRVLLVGDASGYVDALTGEGIRVGLAQARAAIGCIADEDPLRYESEWRSVTRDFRMLTAGLVALAGSPARGAIVPLARALPGVYGAVVERLAR